ATTGPVLVGASGASGSFSVTDQATAENKILLIGRNLADLSGESITNGSGPSAGTLTIAGGGRITTTGGLDSDVPDAIGAGTNAFGNGVGTGAGSQWSIAQNFAIGIAGGTGSLTIEQGGTVDVVGFIGVGVGIDPQLGGFGTLSVLDGGSLNVNVGGFVGAGNATGIATVSGVGSTWSI